VKKAMRLASIILMVALIFSFAGGCTPSGQNATISTQGTQDGTPTKEDEKKTGPSWSWDTSPFEIKNWYVGVPTFNKEWDPENCMLDKIIFDKTGLEKVEFTISATAQNEKLNAMIASNSMPDVITVVVNNSKELIKILEEEGLVESLFDLMEEHAPTFTDEAKKAETMVNYWMREDGKMYGIPNRSATGREERVVPKYTTLRTYARKDYMEQLNIKPEDLNTQDGMVEALKKFKDSGITDDGAYVYPMLMTEIKKPYTDYEFVAQHFGFSNEDDQGNYVQAIKDPKYYEMLQFMNRLFREGVFTERNIIMKLAEAREIAASSRFFLHFGHDAITSQCRDATKTTNGEIYYLPVGPVRSNDGGDPAFALESGGTGWAVTYITKNATNKDRIIKLMEFLYSREGNILCHFGVEGETYEIDKDGLYTHTDNYKKELAADRALAEKKYGLGTFWMLDDRVFINSINKDNFTPYDDMEIQLQMFEDINKNSERYSYINDCYHHKNVDPEAGTPESDINAQVNIYLDQQVIKIISAKTAEEFDSFYEEGVKRAEELGLNELWEVQNANYQAMKKKLGVDFAFPRNKN